MALENKKIAIFIADLYEDLEFWYPYLRMKEEKAEMTVIGPDKGSFSGKHGLPASSDMGIKEARPGDYDALIIPGGYSPDMMRRSPDMVKFVREINSLGRPVAAICHAGWMLASADIIDGREVTSFYSIKDDLIHAGAKWVDKKVVIDGNVITSRNPHDLPDFCRAIIKSIAG
jgi:protease I